MNNNYILYLFNTIHLSQSIKLTDNITNFHVCHPLMEFNAPHREMKIMSTINTQVFGKAQFQTFTSVCKQKFISLFFIK